MGNAYRMRLLVPSNSPTVDMSSVNFTFEDISAGGTSGNLAALAAAGSTFLNGTAAGQSIPLGGYYSLAADRGVNHGIIHIYNITGHLDGSLAGAPVLSSTFTLAAAAGGGGALPEGVAAAISWRADYGLDPEFGPISDIPTPPDIIADYGAAPTHKGRTRPRQRDRNRTYLGPLNNQTITTESGTNRCILSGQFINDCLRALFLLADVAPGGVPNFGLRAWSRRNASLRLVTLGYMDDRPDFQRRRSDPSTLRTTLAMPSA